MRCAAIRTPITNSAWSIRPATSGADIDLIEAHKWFNLAAVRGHEAAQYCRAEVADEMTAREIATAQAAARAFLNETSRRAA